VTVPAQQTELTAILDQAREEDVLIRTADGSEFLVSAVDDFDLEIARTRKNTALMELLEVRARQSETIPLDEVKDRLGLSG
jgi:hypothetical protein